MKNHLLFVVVLGLALAPRAAAADVQVLTQHNDPQRTGANLAEPILTPALVGSPAFDRLGSYAVTGQVFAQPLFTSIDGAHTLYVATMKNLVYAFDADQPGSTSKWVFDAGSNNPAQAARLYPGRGPDISPEVGILSTPVIDLAHFTLYVVAMTQPDRNRDEFFHTLHAVDIRTGKARGAVRITGTIDGGGIFNSGRQNQRAALALIGDRVYVAWAGFGDIAPYDGLVMSYGIVDSPAPLQKRGQFQVARFDPLLGARHKSGGIWQSGGGPAVDEQGEFFYVVTGNGSSSNAHAGEDFDSSDVKLDPDLRVIDYFTPSFQNFLNENDLDLSVSGPMIPAEWRDRAGHVVRRLLHGSKQGILYNLNRDNMGKFHEHDNPIQQVTVFDEPNPGATMPKRHIHTTPTLWVTDADRRVYVGSDWGLGIKAYRFNDDGTLNPTAFLSTVRDPHRYAITQMSLSANGPKDGVLWAIGCIDCVTDNPPDTISHNKQSVLLAYDAARLGAPVYTSPPLGTYPRFNAPTVANGRVYVPTFSGEVVVFGSKTTAHSAAQAQARRSFLQGNWGKQGNFELLVPERSLVKQYFRNNDDPAMAWHFLRNFGYPVRPNQLGPMPRSVTFIQSNYKGDGVHGNFETIVRLAPPIATQPDRLDFWFLDSRQGKWNGPFPLAADGQPMVGATGDPVFFQSNWGRQGNFELLVPQGSVVREYVRNNDDPAMAWHFLRNFGYPARPNQLGPTPRSVTFIQSNYKGDGVHGNFEAIVRVAPPLATQPDTLDFWFLDSRQGKWNGPFPLSADGQPMAGVSGDPVLIQSDWGNQGNFELLVPQGSVIKQYFRNNDDPAMAWHFLRNFGYPTRPNQLGPTPRSVTFIQSNYKGDGVHGNFEAIVRVAPPVATQPDSLDFWFLDSRQGKWNGPFPLSADGQPMAGVTGN